MAVVGVLVQAEVRDQDGVGADLDNQVGQGELHDPGGVVGGRPARVLDGGHPEQDEATDARGDGLRGRLAQRVAGVLDDPGQRRHGHRLGQPLLDEQWLDQIRRMQPHLRDEPPQRGAPPQPTRPHIGERAGHRRRPRSRDGRLTCSRAFQVTANWARASTRTVTEGSGAMTSSRSPCSAIVSAVLGPIAPRTCARAACPRCRRGCAPSRTT